MGSKSSAAAPETEPQAAEEMQTIETLALSLAVPEWTMAGLKMAMGWGEGKEMTEAEFSAAMQDWLSGPMTREV